MLEALPTDMQAIVRVEVSAPQDELPLRAACPVDRRWLHRGETPAARSRLLLEALREIEIPLLETDRFIWCAAEAEIARSAKTWLRQEAGLPAADIMAAGFWRAA